MALLCSLELPFSGWESQRVGGCWPMCRGLELSQWELSVCPVSGDRSLFPGNAWPGTHSAEQSEPLVHSQGACTDRGCLCWLSALYHTKVKYFALKLNILSC